MLGWHLILASAGLLAGRQATTHWAYRTILENLGATYVPGRWVGDGKFITSGGVSCGIDMGLHLVGKHKNERSACQVQLWVEYDSQPPFGRLDYDDIGLALRAGRAWVSLTTPLLTDRPKQCTRHERATASRPVELSELGG